MDSSPTPDRIPRWLVGFVLVAMACSGVALAEDEEAALLHFEVQCGEERVVFDQEARVVEAALPHACRYSMVAQDVTLQQAAERIRQHMRVSVPRLLADHHGPLDVADVSPWQIMLELAKATNTGFYDFGRFSRWEDIFIPGLHEYVVREPYLIIFRSVPAHRKPLRDLIDERRGKDLGTHEILVMAHPDSVSTFIDVQVEVFGIDLTGERHEVPVTEIRIHGVTGWALDTTELPRLEKVEGKLTAPVFVRVLEVASPLGARFNFDDITGDTVVVPRKQGVFDDNVKVFQIRRSERPDADELEDPLELIEFQTLDQEGDGRTVTHSWGREDGGGVRVTIPEARLDAAQQLVARVGEVRPVELEFAFEVGVEAGMQE